MPVDINKLADAPIVILTFSDSVTSGDLETAFATIAQLADQRQHVYIVSDLGQFSVNTSAIWLGLRMAVRAVPGGPGDLRTTHIVTGNNRLVKQAVEFIQRGQYGKFDVKHFATVDEASTFARSQLG